MVADATLSIIPRLFDTVVRRWGPQGEGLNVQIVMRERPCGIMDIENSTLYATKEQRAALWRKGAALRYTCSNEIDRESTHVLGSRAMMQPA